MADPEGAAENSLDSDQVEHIFHSGEGGDFR